MDAATARLEGSNLNDYEQNRRLRIGVAAYALTLAVGVVLVKLGVAPAWRLLLLVPFGAASNGIFMGMYRT